MVTKEELKKEIDKLPESLLDEVYNLLKSLHVGTLIAKKEFKKRDFGGKFDEKNVRGEAYE